MKTRVLLFAAALLAPLACRADDYLTQSQIETMQRNGWITPAVEAAVRELIDANQRSARARADQAGLELKLPLLQKDVADADAKVATLKDELSHYEHPDETDFAALQDAMKNPNATTRDQMARAQAYVWTYPGGTHTAEAGQILSDLQKKIADQEKATQDAAAADEAAHLKLLARVKARDLNLGEWRSFLQDKSQDEVRQYLGAPSSQGDGFWTYNGTWTVDPVTNQKAGLQITFNGGRVQAVAVIPSQ